MVIGFRIRGGIVWNHINNLTYEVNKLFIFSLMQLFDFFVQWLLTLLKTFSRFIYFHFYFLIRVMNVHITKYFQIFFWSSFCIFFRTSKMSGAILLEILDIYQVISFLYFIFIFAYILVVNLVLYLGGSRVRCDITFKKYQKWRWIF